jgi:cupin fold WbuC family metalloprotein
VKLVSQGLLEELAARAAASPRGRAHHNLHASADDRVQRFLVAAMRNSYFRPHRHTTRAELAVLLRGRVTVVLFDERGLVTGRCAVGDGSGNVAYETASGVWHTLIVEADGTTFLEIKEGPYDPASASEFAAWSPPEGDARAAQFLEWARGARPGERAPAL